MNSGQPGPIDSAGEGTLASVRPSLGEGAPDDLTLADDSMPSTPDAGEGTQAHDETWTAPGDVTTQARSAPKSTLRVAPVIPGYEIEGELGRGGMGVVYKARQVLLNRDCALKMILAAEHAGVEAGVRFLAEAEAVAKLKHPNIVQIFHFDEHDGHPYFEMEYVDGGSLADRLDGVPRPPRQAAKLVEALAGAMGEAHRRGIVHRDLKPANILVTSDGAPKVADFGLAKMLNAESGLTRTDSVLGSPSYMAPEQAEGKTKEVGPAADVYALGAILYELLVGRPPFRGATVLDTLQQVKTAEPVSPSRLVPGLPRDIETIAQKCLQKDPGKRYDSAAALAEDLRRFQAGEPIVARPVGAMERTWRWCRRNPALAGSLGAVAVALGSVAVVSTVFAVKQAEATARISGLADSLGGEKAKLERSLVESNRRLALLNYERGQAECKQSEIGPGLLWLIESWRSAAAAGDPTRERAARANLSAWQGQLPRLKAVFSHDTALGKGLAFSPDGKTVLAGSYDKTARLWNAVTGSPIGEVMRHGGGIEDVAFSLDGKSLLTGSADGMARLWDATTGRLLVPPMQHGNEVKTVAFSRDGKTILTASVDMTARLWDASNGKQIGGELGHENEVWVAVFSPDDKTILTGSFDKTARLWDAFSGKQIGETMQHRDWVSTAEFSPDGKSVLTGSRDGKARLWDATTGRLVVTMTHGGWVRAAKFSPDGKTIVTSGEDKTAKLGETATGERIGETMRHGDGVKSAVFHPDGKTVLTGSADGTARRWDATTGRPLGAPMRHQGPIWSVAFSPDGRSVLTGSLDRTARLWEIPAEPVGSTLSHDSAVTSVTFSPDGKTILSGSGNDTLYSGDVPARSWTWDAAGGRHSVVTLPHGGHVEALEFSPDDKTVVTVSWDKTAMLWDAVTGEQIGKTMRHDGQVVCAAFSPDGKTVVTGGYDVTAQIWSTVTGEPIGEPLRHAAWVSAVAFSPDGKAILTGDTKGRARIWDLETGGFRDSKEPHFGPMQCVAFSPDGQTFLTGSEDGTARLWDAATGLPEGPPLRHGGWVRAVAFSPDGQTFLTGSGDGTAQLWYAATQQPIGPPMRHQGPIRSVAISPDGKTIATASDDRTLRLWPTADLLPDDLDQVANWVEAVTGLTLDASGSIKVLDNATWLGRRDEVKRQGGPPVTVPER